MKDPIVSIVIINYNTLQLTADCVKSIIASAQNISYEIIVVDNASPDKQGEIIRNLFPDVVYIQSQQNIGFAKGNNLGILQARGEFVLLLNSDTVFKNNVLKILTESITAHRKVAVISAHLEYPDGAVQHCCQRFPSIRYKLFELLRLQKIFSPRAAGKILLGSFFKHDGMAFPDWVWGTCFMFRRDLLTRLPENKLPDNYFMYGEDMQWCMEFRKLGYKIMFNPEARVIHYMGKSGAPKSDMIVNNMRNFMNTYYSPFHQRILNLLDRLLA